MNDAPPARYLPIHLADALRQTFAAVPDIRARAELVTMIEDAYACGYADGYTRGYPDGAADRDASLTAADVLDNPYRAELQVRVTAP
jgi:hypothetical protein